MYEPVSTTLIVPGDQSMVALLGSGDELLRVIERSVVSDVHVRGNEITITGKASDNAVAVRLFEELLDLIRGGTVLSQDAVSRTMGILTSDSGERPAEVLSLNILSRRGKNIRPKTLNQKRYVDAIDHHTVVFGIGPAGTGKTYLAVAKAVQALQAKQVNRIILTRPAVEAGERLGFLPGTLFDKIDPYLRPLLDALHDMVDPESIPRLMQAGTIEIAPLAYMRGRAQPYSTQVATPQGFRSLGTLEVGDLVIGSDGTPTPVLGVYPQGEKEVFRVRTQDGASTLACGEHLWSVRTVDDRSHGRPSRVLETREMIGNLKRGRVRRYELPLVQPVEFEPRETPIDAYALGLLLGDGCLTTQTTPSFTTADPELAVALEAAVDGVTLRRKSAVDYVLTNDARTVPRGGTLRRQPGHRGASRSRSGRHPVADQVRPDGIPVQLGRGPDRRAARAAGQRRWPGRAERTDLPHPVLDHLRPAARRRDLARPFPGRRRLLRVPARRAGRRPGLARGRAVEHRHDALRSRHPACRPGSSPSASVASATPTGAVRRRDAHAVHRQHRVGRRPWTRCASRWPRRTRSTSPTTSWSRTTP